MRSYLQVSVSLLVAISATAQASAISPLPDDKYRTPYGVTAQGKWLQALDGGDYDYRSAKPRILLVVTGTGKKTEELIAPWGLNEMMTVATVSVADLKSFSFPPDGEYYHGAENSDAQYLWRYIGMYAPDLVVEVALGEAEEWQVPKAISMQPKSFAKGLPNVRELPDSSGLVSQLTKSAPCATGVIPAVRVVAKDPDYLKSLQRALINAPLSPSPARMEIQRRLVRSPDVIAQQLLGVYGKKLDSVQYIPALAIVGRLRADRLIYGDKAPIAPVALSAVEPYLSGKKAALAPKGGGSGTAGNLLFGELAEITGDKRYVELVKAAADQAFDADGKPREAMPAHSEMSDAVFMGCPILAQAGKLTGDRKYFDACLQNLRFMKRLCRRIDHLYRHSPLDETAWGRGNGFPALGLAWSLAEIPDSYSGKAEILAAYRNHMDAMLHFQDTAGCWHQVVDKPESYREFTVTAMTTYAMARGVRMGWIPRERFGSAIERGWYALRARIGSDGGLVDVCTGTGKQKSLRDYYDRTAILGRDDRGGAMALMVSTEMMQYEKWLTAKNK